MKAGVGAVRGTDSRESGRAAARLALQRMQGGDRATWAMAFSSRFHAGADVVAGIRDVLGRVPVVGGAAVGAITGDLVGYGGDEVAVAAFPAPAGGPRVLVQGQLDQGEHGAGLSLGRRLAAEAPAGSVVVMFYDSIRSFGPPPVLNVGSLLLKGLHEGLAGHPIDVIGGGTVQDLDLSSSHVLDGDGPVKQSAVAVVLPPPVRCRTVIMHGCTPVSDFHRITRVEGPVLYELDGRPALDVAAEFLGQPIPTPAGPPTGPDILSLSLTLGQKLGDPFAPYDESNYVNRLILAPLVEARALLLFEADFEPGALVQFMSRDNAVMLESVRRGVASLRADPALADVGFVLYADCAGRTRAFNGADDEEAEALASGLPTGLPLLGFYSGVEIASLQGRSRPLDWTGVLGLIDLG